MVPRSHAPVRLVLLLLALCASSAAMAQRPGAKPNGLLIVSDDQGFSDFGFTGNPLGKTPVPDPLAADRVGA